MILCVLLASCHSTPPTTATSLVPGFPLEVGVRWFPLGVGVGWFPLGAGVAWFPLGSCVANFPRRFGRARGFRLVRVDIEGKGV